MPRPVATSAYAARTPRRGMSPSSVAPRQQRSQPGRRHNGACPEWRGLKAPRGYAKACRHKCLRGEHATTGLAPNGVDLRPHAGMPRPVATSAYAASTPRRGMSPSSVAPRQQRSQPGRRHNGACPRWAMLLAQHRYLARSSAPLGRAGQAQRWREWARAIWRGASLRWDKPSGGGNGQRARATCNPISSSSGWRQKSARISKKS